MDPLVVRHTVLLPHRCGRVQLTGHFLRAKVLHRIPREAVFFSLVKCRDDGAPGAATALGDARFVETQTMKSDDLFVVGHRVFLLLLDYIFRCNSIIQGVSDRRRECMISAVKLSDLCGQSVRRRAAYSSRFKVMFYVIGSENSKSGSAFYNSRQQNQRRGGAVRYFRSVPVLCRMKPTSLLWVEHFYSVVM